MKYYAEITGWGDEAKAFLKELNYIILFNDNAPSELAEISILHSIGEMKGDIEVGDTIIIAEKAFEVTAIGDEAQKTFKELGHATINFAGRDVPDLPGHIMLKGDEALTEDDIVKGAKIEIY